MPDIAGYQILDELGRGGMGVVFKAREKSGGGLVALKVLPGASPAALYRFKQEFRTLSGVSHRNLVGLYELIADGSVWCFTMELIDGLDFRRYVRGAAAGVAGLDEGRLREAIRQLAEGVVALHGAGKLHRDLKPSNVMVTETGRVVILDFGLAAELSDAGLHQSTENHILGTIAYMSPEQQAAAQPVSSASDWYSVGVMLYEALTGTLPFPGSGIQVLQEKQQREPPPPSQLTAGIPEDLDSLCVDLLRRRPDARPDGQKILKRLGGGKQVSPLHTPAKHALPFVGREEQLAALNEAFAAVRQGRPVTFSVQGRSGVGKTTLVHRLLEAPQVVGEAVVLAGRCYERESVPYKALDSLVDALSRYLRRLPPAEVEALLPRDVGPLARLFPVLLQVDTVACARRRSAEIPDLQELRRRAFAALREFLGRLGERRPLILFIDDLQWGDIDSAALLIDLIRPPDAPVLLLLACFRSEEAATSPCLQTLRESLETIGQALDRRQLTLEPLTAEEVRNLTRLLLGNEDHAEAIGRESGGNPFFVYELVQHLQARSAEPLSVAEAVTLDQVLWGRVQRLPAEARRLLEVIAVAGRPLAQIVACRAADLPGQEPTSAALRAGRLIRSTGLAGQEEVETYHDRVRETVVAHLTPEALQEHHRRLAEAFEAAGQADPEVLAIHWNGAKEGDRAGRYYALAADQAAEALAFDRAAKLYRLALELRPIQGDEARQVRTNLGDALANAGRGTEAAREYITAARDGATAETLELKRRAAMQLLMSGRVDEGMALLHTVLSSAGIKLPKTPRSALWSLLYRRLLLRLRGLRFQKRDTIQIPVAELERIDLHWAVATGLSAVDPIRGADFQTRCLLYALRAGEPYRIARSLALEAVHVSTSGRAVKDRTALLLQTGQKLAEEVGNPHALGMIMLGKGIAAYLEGCWREAREWCNQAESTFRVHCRGVAWEIDTVLTFSLWTHTYVGDLAELSRRWPVCLKEAQDHSDLFATMNFCTYMMAMVRLGANDPEGAQRQLDEVVRQWSREGFHIQHHNAILAQTLIHLYTGNSLDAWRFVEKQWPAYNRSLLLRVQQIRVDAMQLRARSAIAAASVSPYPKPFLRVAEKIAYRLRREDNHWAEAHATLIQASVASDRGDFSGALVFLREASGRFDAVEMHLFAAAARRRLGELLGGDEGRDLIAQADTWMTGQGIVDSVRMTAMLAPGFPARNAKG